MDDPSAAEPLAGHLQESRPEPRWGAWMAFLTAWILPATTARRTQHVSLVLAGLVHVIALIIAVGILLFVVAYTRVFEPFFFSIEREFTGLVADLLERMPLQAFPVLPRVLVTLVMVEFGVVCLAILLSPWGARDEPMSASYGHALRRVWLQTAHLVQIALIIGVLVVVLNRAEGAWRAAHPSPEWTAPLPPPSLSLVAPADPDYRRAWDDYSAAVQQHDRAMRAQWEAWANKQPLYVSNPYLLLLNLCVVATMWWLYSMLRAIGTGRSASPIDRQPLCDVCGYNLTGIHMDGQCPECGESIFDSLGANARAGPMWRRRGQVGRCSAWWQCCAEVIIRPTQFGRQIQLVSPGTDHRRYLVLCLAIMFFLAPVGSFTCIAVAGRMNTLQDDSAQTVVAGLVIGGATVISALVLVHLSALLAAVWYGRGRRRNLMSSSIQIACYLGGLLLFCLIFAAILGSLVLAAHNNRWFRIPARLLRVDLEEVAFVVWLVPILLSLVVYFHRVFRGTAATRYANR